ncbi:hypothetical protein Q3A91_14645 [Nocardia mangyaensis]|nr:hypothetical protein [Nocardia mangyaensis]MDO3648207.1 hypothetical protein [Nocardia mangyaensis]
MAAPRRLAAFKLSINALSAKMGGGGGIVPSAAEYEAATPAARVDTSVATQACSCNQTACERNAFDAISADGPVHEIDMAFIADWEVAAAAESAAAACPYPVAVAIIGPGPGPEYSIDELISGGSAAKISDPSGPSGGRRNTGLPYRPVNTAPCGATTAPPSTSVA